MKRIVFYVVSANSEENQRGIFHYSEPFMTEAMARIYATDRKKSARLDETISIEKHNEVFENNSWELDPDSGGIVFIDYI